MLNCLFSQAVEPCVEEVIVNFRSYQNKHCVSFAQTRGYKDFFFFFSFSLVKFISKKVFFSFIKSHHYHIIFKHTGSGASGHYFYCIYDKNAHIAQKNLFHEGNERNTLLF